VKASEDALQDYALKSGEQDPLVARRFERREHEAESPEIGGEVPPRRGTE
jgi:hypothetical protein